MMGGSGGGGGDVPLLTRAQWNALSTAQKQAYGLVAIQDANSGYDRGELLYGADYIGILPAEMVPIHSWNASTNALESYSFASTTLANKPTLYCMAAMLQNGGSPAWDASSNLLPAMSSGTDGNGSYALVYGAKANGDYASTYSSGDNWNNSEIVCFCFNDTVNPVIKELFFEQGQNGTYTYSYQATGDECLLLIAMRGGSAGNSYTISGLTQRSHVTSSGARFNDVYFDQVEAGDTVSVSIPYAAGNNSNGALFVVLLSLS